MNSKQFIYYFAAVIGLLFITSVSRAQTEREYKTADVIVTAGRIPLSFPGLSRNITVIYSSEMLKLPVNKIQDILKYIPGVDLKARGTEGIQADLSIRGGTFEQTLVLLDGIKINDAQTGHHNLNLPVGFQDVERIEVLKGPGSRIFGPDAFNGVVNIITKKVRESGIGFSLLGGQHSLYDASLNGSYSTGGFSGNINLSKSRSDGYRHNTDFDAVNAAFSSSVSAGKSVANIFLGFLDKDFGANGFYSSKYPNQREHIKTKFASISGETETGSVSISPRIYWRQNGDDYLLDYENPAYYRNIHTTDSFGFEIQSSITSRFGTTSIGGEISGDEIKSTNLGNHSRIKKGLFAEQYFNTSEKLSVSAGIFLYDYAEAGWKLWPGIDAGYYITDDLKIFLTWGRSFRLPTFTELYYSSPAQIGNADLSFEANESLELGTALSVSNFKFNLSVFGKKGENIIDWVRSGSADPWQAQNIASVRTYGAEAGVVIDFSGSEISGVLSSVSLNYSYLYSDRQTGEFQSRYLLDYLRHQALIDLSAAPYKGIEQNLFIRYEDRIGLKRYLIADYKVSYIIRNLQLFISASNLFNSAYQDYEGIPLPGRWIKAGISYRHNDL